MNLDDAIYHTERMTMVPCGEDVDAEYQMYAGYLRELRDARRKLNVLKEELAKIARCPYDDKDDARAMAIEALRKVGVTVLEAEDTESPEQAKERIKEYLLKRGWSTSYDGNPKYDFLVNHSSSGMEYVVALRKASITARELRYAVEGIAGFYGKDPYEMRHLIMKRTRLWAKKDGIQKTE